MTSACFSSSLMRIEVICAGLNDRAMKSCVFVVYPITSIFSFLSSRTIPWIRTPFIPTHAPTGSIRSSYDSTATLALSPGIRTVFLIVISPSKISGTSCSIRHSKKRGDVRDSMICGVAFPISTRSTTARIDSPFRRKSLGICSLLGSTSSFPSSSSSIASRRRI